MPRLSALVVLVSVVSLASVVTCRPTDTDSFDFISWPGDESVGKPLQLAEAGFGSTNPLPFDEPFNVALPPDGNFDSNSLIPPLFDDASLTSPSTPFPFDIAEGTLCPGENRYASCCKGDRCVVTYPCDRDEVLKCCTVDPDDVNRTPRECTVPGSSSLPQAFNEYPGGFYSQLPSDTDSNPFGDLGEGFSDFSFSDFF